MNNNKNFLKKKERRQVCLLSQLLSNIVLMVVASGIKKRQREREREREGEGAKLEGYITRRQAVPHSYSNPDRGVGIMVKEQNETHINS